MMKQQIPPELAFDAAETSSEHRTNTIWISVLACIVLVIMALISARVWAGSASRDFTGMYLSASFAVVALIAAVLSQRGFHYLGSGILIFAVLLVTLMLPYLAAGQVTAPAIASLLIVSAIATATLPSKWSFRVNLLAIFFSVAVIVIDLYLPPDFGIRSAQIAAVPLSIGLAALYVYFILRRFSFYPLRLKLLIAFVLLTIIPLTVIGWYYNSLARNNLRVQGNTQLQSLANLTATQVDAFIGGQLDSMRVESQQPTLAWYLELNPFLRAGTEQESGAAQTLSSFMGKNPDYIESYALLDLQGINVLDTVKANIGRQEDKAEYFTRVMQGGEVYTSNLVFGDETPDLVFSAPVRNQAGEIIGVLRAEYNAAVLQWIINSILVPGSTDQALAIVDTSNYLRIASSGNPAELYKSYRPLTEQNLAMLQEQGVLPRGPSEQVLSPSSEMIASLENIRLVPFFTRYSDELRDQGVFTAASSKTMPWLVMAGRSESSLFAPIRQQTRSLVLLSLALIIAAALSSLLASQVLMAPITSLTEVAERISTGYLTARAQASTRDEIGTLAFAFNNMTYQLRQAVVGLEARVKERTADLEKARQLSEQRASSLQAISNIARAVSAEQNLETLLPLVTRLVSDTFAFYHTGIFLVDSTGKFAVLRAANSEGGQRMLQRGHRLEVGQTGIVGFVAQRGKARIALDVGADAVFFSNPDLPETRSELALPLVIRGRTIGVLDVQSTQPGAFTDEDISTLSIMADQIAIAIENAQLFGQTQQALEEVRALYSQYLHQEWEAFAQEGSHVGYYHSLSGGGTLERPIESEHIQKAMEQGTPIVLDTDGSRDRACMVVPVKLRGKPIGVLNIVSPEPGRSWSEEDLELAQAISDRLALALENARLLQDSLRRAAKEQKISQITSRIGASINMRNMLQTAVEELGRALPGSEVVIQFQRNGDGPAQNKKRQI